LRRFRAARKEDTAMFQADGYHTVEEIAPRTWRIDEAGMANCYLLVGDDAALLIDSGCGAGDLQKCVSQLTRRPVIAAATHRHPDHVGGAWRFGSYYASPADIKPVYSLMCRPVFSRAMIRNFGLPRAAAAGAKRAPVLPMEDGQVFRLGGRSVSVGAVPGHTRGSVVFIDGGEKLVFTGDDINPDLWMHLPGCTSLETWLPGADRIIGIMAGGFAAWNGHGDGRQPLEQARRTRELVSELLEKRRTGALAERRGSYPSKDAGIVVRYRF